MLAWIWSCKKIHFAEKGWWGQGKRIFIFSALGCDELTHTLFQICATSTCHLLLSFAILGRQRFRRKCDKHKLSLHSQVKILLLFEYIIVHPFLVLCVIPPIHWIYSAKTFSHGMMWLLMLAQPRQTNQHVHIMYMYILWYDVVTQACSAMSDQSSCISVNHALLGHFCKET